MPTVSVKLTDAIKRRLDVLSAVNGTSPHAFMVEAIEARLDSEEAHGAFVKEALHARDELVATGKAFDGDEVIAYLNARARGERAPRPRLKSVKALLK